MANAKKLSAPQVEVLRGLARDGVVPPAKGRSAAGGRGKVVGALRRRGLIGPGPNAYCYRITPAGRQALFEATGENTSST